MKKEYRSALRQPAYWVAACTVLLAACQGAEQQTQQQEEQEPEVLRAMAASPKPPPQYLTRYVKKCELDIMRSDLDTFFRSGPDDRTLGPISQSDVDVNWHILDSLVNVAKGPGSGYKRGLWVNYGIKAGNPPNTPDQFTIGFSVAELTDPNTDSTEWKITDVPNHFFVRNTQGQWTDIGSKNNWNEDEAYMARVHLRRASDVPPNDMEIVQNGFDTRAYLMQWEGELKKLMGDNADPPTIRFASIAIQKELVDGEQYDLRHYVVAVAVGSNGSELITNDSVIPATPFKNRGADLQNPCPSRCPGQLAAFPVQGAPLRVNCP